MWGCREQFSGLRNRHLNLFWKYVTTKSRWPSWSKAPVSGHGFESWWLPLCLFGEGDGCAYLLKPTMYSLHPARNWFLIHAWKIYFIYFFFLFLFLFLFFLCMHVWMKCNFRKCIIFWSTTLIILIFSFLFIILSYCKSNISSAVIEWFHAYLHIFFIFFFQ